MATVDELLAAIGRDDAAEVAALLTARPNLVTARVRKPKLLEAPVVHWLYESDTALHWAAATYRVAIARTFIEREATVPAITNRRGAAPLHYAADGQPEGVGWNPAAQVATIRCLLQGGAPINGQDKNGATALHRAVRARCAAAAEMLLRSGADPTVRNRGGSTPFHLAVQSTGRGGVGSTAARIGQRSIIEAFLSRRVDIGLRDGKGRTVLEVARSEWVRALLAYT